MPNPKVTPEMVGGLAAAMQAGRDQREQDRREDGTATPMDAAFGRASAKHDLAAAVQAARRVVIRDLLGEGLELYDAPSLARSLVGEQIGHETWRDTCTYLFAALAMGIAIGQLTHPDVFAKGGQR